MTKDAKAQLAKLKENFVNVTRFEEEGNKYGIYIVDRGELLFYQENEKALFVEISARYALINPDTINGWDNGHKITAAETPALVERIQYFYKKAFREEIKIFKENG